MHTENNFQINISKKRMKIITCCHDNLDTVDQNDENNEYG